MCVGDSVARDKVRIQLLVAGDLSAFAIFPIRYLSQITEDDEPEILRQLCCLKMNKGFTR